MRISADESYHRGTVYGGTDASINARHKHVQSVINEPVNKLLRKYREMQKRGEITMTQYFDVYDALSKTWGESRRLLSDDEVEQIIMGAK